MQPVPVTSLICAGALPIIVYALNLYAKTKGQMKTVNITPVPMTLQNYVQLIKHTNAAHQAGFQAGVNLAMNMIRLHDNDNDNDHQWRAKMLLIFCEILDELKDKQS